jgi:hypothetical protein
MRRLALVLVAVVGCGDEPKAKPVATRTPVPTATAAASASPASVELLNLLRDQTQDRARLCEPAGEVPAPAVAAVNCDYDATAQGSWLQFESHEAMLEYFNDVRATSLPIRGSECSFRRWRRGTRPEGRAFFGRDGRRKVLIWTNDSDRIVGEIRATGSRADEVCAIWRVRS